MAVDVTWSAMIGARGLQSEALAHEAKRRATQVADATGATDAIAAVSSGVSSAADGLRREAGDAVAGFGGIVPDVLDTANTWTRWTSAAVIALALALALGAVGFITWNIRKVIA
ncbi:MAG: hypothetical protein RIS45_1911 [Planctomycetota bacterium]